MKTVWKYPVECNSVKKGFWPIAVVAPIGAKPLFFGLQGKQVCLWAEVDPAKKGTSETLRFACIGTGHGIVPDECDYFGTVIADPYVWHLYRLPPEKK